MNKLLLASSLAFLAGFGAVFFSGCANTPVGVVAQEGAGDIFAGYELSTVTNSASAAQTVSALNRLASDLPGFPAGKISQMEAGALAAQLQQAKLGIPASQTKVLDQLNSLMDLVAQGIAGSSSGGITAGQGILIANFTNAAVGINQAIQYYQGKWSVTNPTWLPPLPPGAAPNH